MQLGTVYSALDVTRPGAQPVPGFRLLHRLGRGGIGDVWKAEAAGGFHVALKFVLLTDRCAGADELRALEIARVIRHPNLVVSFGAWLVDDYLVIGMELADRTLWDRFREAAQAGLTGIPRDELLEHFAEAAKGIDYLNEPRHRIEGQEAVAVQHRDVKPQNILLFGGGVKVGDIGMARLLAQPESCITVSGSWTFAYAAPEFFRKEAAHSSDQYSLAASYCHLRGGRVPFPGTAGATMAGHLHCTPDLTMLPEEERPVVARALAKDPEERWPSCRTFVEALRSVGAAERNTGPPARFEPQDSGSTGSSDSWIPSRLRRLPSDQAFSLPDVDELPPVHPISSVFLSFSVWNSRDFVKAAAWTTAVLGALLLLLVIPPRLLGTKPKARVTPDDIATRNRLLVRIDVDRGPAVDPPGATSIVPTNANLTIRTDRAKPIFRIGEDPEGALPPLVAPAENSDRGELPSHTGRLTPSPEPSKPIESHMPAEVAAPSAAPAPAPAARTTATPEREKETVEVKTGHVPTPSAPAIRLEVPDTLTLKAGDSTSFPVKVRRDGVDGPVTIRFEGVPAGVSMPDLTIPAEADQADVPVTVPAQAPGARQEITAVGTTGEIRSEATLQATVKADPALIYVRRGNASFEAGDWDRAIGEFSEALRLDPENALAYSSRASAQHKKGNIDLAIADYTEAMRLNPTDPVICNNRGLAYREKGLFYKAIADYDEALRLKAKDAVVHYNRGMAYSFVGDAVSAIADFTEAIRFRPQFAEAYRRRSEALLKRGDDAGAQADLDEALRLDRERPTPADRTRPTKPFRRS